VSKIFDIILATSGRKRLFIDIGRQQGRELGDKFTAYSQERIICHPVHDLKKEIWKYERPYSGYTYNDLWSSAGKPLGYWI
jgi:hypothetical protein